jgi:hypothetical protein
MPKWTEYTSKNTLADNDEVMLYDATARANKRGLMSKFWDYVVDKMATAVIGKLETENKTVIGAINKLNSETVLKRVSVLSDNINDILIAGNYCNIVPVWGNIGGLYPSWAWGIVLTANNIANFIGVDTVGKKLAVAQYSNGTWKKIM